MQDDQNEREGRTVRIIVEAHAQELAILRTLIDKFDRALFGNGQPGLIKDLQLADRILDNRVDNIEKVIIKWGAMVVAAFAIIQFLMGSGILSLKGLLGK